ncbi:MAG: sigma-70 family RNA polymerase sigma factor, partial [Deltaproteobacteria bacterium]
DRAEAPRPVDDVVVPRLDVRTLFDQHFDFVWKSLRRLGVPEADVDDALQEVFVVVHRRLPAFEARSKVTTWLFGICFRVASEQQRKTRARREDITDAMPDAADPGDNPEERCEGREARARLDEVLAQLDADKRAVFVLYEIDENPVEVIAEMVGVPVGTVYSRLRAAREEFDRVLARLRAQWAHIARKGAMSS